MRWFCPHARTRCVHGDEIRARMSLFGRIRRQVCLDCGRALDRGLPVICTITGRRHRYLDDDSAPTH